MCGSVEDRIANVHFDGDEIQLGALPNAGRAYGSRRSLILLAYFNADSVDQRVDTLGSALAYIDDYFRLGVGSVAEREPQERSEWVCAWPQRTGSGLCYLFVWDERRGTFADDQ